MCIQYTWVRNPQNKGESWENAIGFFFMYSSSSSKITFYFVPLSHFIYFLKILLHLYAMKETEDRHSPSIRSYWQNISR